jgi:hypothetical protein
MDLANMRRNGVRNLIAFAATMATELGGSRRVSIVIFHIGGAF